MTAEPAAGSSARPPVVADHSAHPVHSARGALDAEWAEWLERVRATYEAVAYTCAHRLDDAALAGPVAVQVVAGMVARPQVFRYFGLPYSGRIAKLAEARLAEAAAGELAVVCTWGELRSRLTALPAPHRDALVVTCVRGDDVDALAAVLGDDLATAKACHAAMLDSVRELVRPGLPAGAGRVEGED